ncbi:retrovirus-related Pol polyprotein from transposon opus [Nephila pilipes]|uniref:Retrovirus-related Pol polyprotein from transposon opus n=1 Tax=Nephila pilipes TaxID=299642 RepID=A0A8X6MXF0_NEPPI|nr:retrovirus-related Pol polyprotein from transposon opus [Nephila pilipes]
MADGIMAAVSHTSSIDAENQDLKTMLMDSSSGLSSLETRERSTFRGRERRFRRRSASRKSGNHCCSKPIIGADFLRYFGLLVDIRHECMVDLLTKLQTQGTVRQWNNSGVKAVHGNDKFHRLLAEFPSLIESVSIQSN